jgi:hypothetical protein
MDIDENLLTEFESGLNPQKLDQSDIPAALIGFGEISAIFQIGDQTGTAFKRLPLFSDRPSAQNYIRKYKEYCELLGDAGLNLPPDKTFIITAAQRPVVLYIAQKQLPADRFAHRLIHRLTSDEIQRLFENIVAEIAKLWSYNQSALPDLELALDGQLSNWVWLDSESGMTLFYIDTSTPIFRKNGLEQMDPELFLKSAPFFLQWIIRLFFLDDVMMRYYDRRQVYIDLVANLYKEQRPDLIVSVIELINRHLPDGDEPLTLKEVDKYYREDKLIWTLFLTFRRIDRSLTTRVFRRRYEFILPGKIER